MQISERTEKEIKEACKLAKKTKLDILYFADSLGSMDDKDIKKIVKIFKKEWAGNIGIHAHNNLGLALSNSVTALKEGVNWVDSTVMGMGRGAGNAQTEYIILEIEKFKKKFQNNLSLMKVIKKYFYPLYNKYKWGINFYYYLAGKFSIHPTYIQEMINIELTESEMIDGINQLKDYGASRYDVNLVRSEFQNLSNLRKEAGLQNQKLKEEKFCLYLPAPI